MSDETPRTPHWLGSDFQEHPHSEGGVPLCGACRLSEVCRLGLTTEKLGEGGIAEFELTCPPDYEGGPNVAHGGWTAAALDEALGHVSTLHGRLAVTGTLTVRFVMPVPIGRPLLARAWIDRGEGVKWYVSGELVLASSGALLASATGVWIEREPGAHFGGFERWLAEQDEQAGT